jgi:hypothetical protein
VERGFEHEKMSTSFTHVSDDALIGAGKKIIIHFVVL